jgi:hypothetical protein
MPSKPSNHSKELMNNFFQRLNLELIRAGVWGRAAGMLEQDLRDHYLTEKDALLVQGKSSEEADELALAKLGDPVQLAQKARMELDRRDGRLKTQFLLRFVPLALGPLSWCTVMGVFLLLDFFCGFTHHAHRAPHQVEVLLHGLVADVYLPCAMYLFYFLGPWLAAYLWILRASYLPVHGWRYLLLMSGYMTLSYYICISQIITANDGIWFQFSREWTNGFLLLLCLLLLITPWRVRARKRREGEA